MTISIAVKPLGWTYALSVAATQHAAVSIPQTGNEQSNFASFINRGSTDVCVLFSSISTMPVIVFPVDGTPTLPNSHILPAGMTQPLLLAVPANGFYVGAIGSAAGPSIIYITPVGNLS